MRWKLAHLWWGSNPRSLDYIPSSITRHVPDHQRKASQIHFYISGSQNKEIVYENDKNVNWICPMTAILNFTICGTIVSFTAWHRAEMDSAQNFHIKTTNEVLFLKNAYRSLSRAIWKTKKNQVKTFPIALNFTGTSAAALPKCLPDFRTVRWL